MSKLDQAVSGSSKKIENVNHTVSVDDALTTRRALVTGGMLAAGAAAASTLASSEAQAAVTYVKLGALNTATADTVVRTSSAKGLVGSTTATGGLGLSGFSTGSGGVGVTGVSHVGSTAFGVRGASNQGTGVKGESVSGTGVAGTSTNGVGVVGTSTNDEGINGTGAYCGVRANGGSYGVIGYGTGSGTTYGLYTSGSTYGVYSTGTSYGVYATSSSGYGVSALSASGYGVYGSGGSLGVYGVGSTWGVYGGLSGSGGHGVHGQGGQYSVYGSGGGTAGVRGDSPYVGVWGEGATYGANIIATATSGQNFGIYAETKSSAGFAGYFKGNVTVAGTLAKTAGSFKIDHPLDPEHKWLQHSFVESPDMMNVYNGNVTTNSNGTAVVKLPAYFGALNRDFRYQLTVIGKMAQAIIDQKVVNNQFRIRTDQGNVEVSWQVTGIRQDAYAKEHPIEVEVAKTKGEAGTVQFVPKGKTWPQMNVAPRAPAISSAMSAPVAPSEPAPPNDRLLP